MIQDIYKNARPLHLGVGLLAILALLSGCSSDDSSDDSLPVVNALEDVFNVIFFT